MDADGETTPFTSRAIPLLRYADAADAAIFDSPTDLTADADAPDIARITSATALLRVSAAVCVTFAIILRAMDRTDPAALVTLAWSDRAIPRILAADEATDAATDWSSVRTESIAGIADTDAEITFSITAPMPDATAAYAIGAPSHVSTVTPVFDATTTNGLPIQV